MLLILVYLLVLPKTPSPDQEIKKIAEFRNSYLSGYKNNKNSWKFHAEYGWTSNDQDTTNLENVNNGNIYENGELITKNLSAPQVKIHKTSKNIEVLGNNESQIKALIAFTSKKENQKRKFAKIYADFLSYNPDTKKSIIKNNIKIYTNEIILTGNEMLIDHENENTTISNGVKISRNDLSISSKNLIYDAKQEKINVSENIDTKIKAKQKTSVTTSNITLFLDDIKDVFLYGSIEVVQGKKTVFADNGIYNKQKGNIKLIGNVKTIIEKGSAILKENTTKKLTNAEVKIMLKEKTFISSETLILSTKNGNAQAKGNVLVSQKGKEAKANFANYSDASENIVLTENVYMKKSNSWVKCKKVNISVKDEIFEAIGSVEAKFNLK